MAWDFEDERTQPSRPKEPGRCFPAFQALGMAGLIALPWEPNKHISVKLGTHRFLLIRAVSTASTLQKLRGGGGYLTSDGVDRCWLSMFR